MLFMVTLKNKAHTPPVLIPIFKQLFDGMICFPNIAVICGIQNALKEQLIIENKHVPAMCESPYLSAVKSI